ncbi:MAG: phosphate/phosphite/phosphonate ABC transporter substrate-binding protein [Cyanobium sp.]
MAGIALIPSPPAEAASCVGKPGGKQWRVGVVPQLPPRQIIAAWQPLLTAVGQRSGQCFELVVAASIPAFEQQLRSGSLDFAFLNPYHQVMAHKWQGFVPLVRDRRGLEGLLMVRRDSPVKKISDLQGAVVAFPSPNSFAASLLIRALLARDGVSISPRYVKTHSNVYRSVVFGSSRAGGGVNNTFIRERPEVQQQLRVLWRTPDFPAHPFSASKRVPVATQGQVLGSFLQLGSSAEGRKLLTDVQMPNPVKANQARDYAPLARLGLGSFVVINGD